MNISGVKNALLPAKSGYTYPNLRVSDYGDLFNVQALPAGFTSALEGSMFVAQATPAAGGTGVAMGIQTTFSDTANIALLLKNGEAAGGKSYIPVFLRGRITAAGSTTTSAEVAVQVDAINRYSSGGTALGNVHCVNPANTTASLATCYTGAITAAAAGTNRRYIGQSLLKVAAAPLWLVNDVVLITFGAPGQFVQQSQVLMSDSAAPVVTTHVPMPACAIPAVGSMTVHIANVANATTPPSIAWEAGWIER